MYSDFSQKKEEKSSIDAKIESLKTELDSLNKKKDQVANDKATRDAIAQYASMYREDLILNQVYAKLD